jgi:hypothetical protein
MLALPEDAKGPFLVVTENGSRYLIDLDSFTVIREPDPNQQHVHLRRERASCTRPRESPASNGSRRPTGSGTACPRSRTSGSCTSLV